VALPCIVLRTLAMIVDHGSNRVQAGVVCVWDYTSRRQLAKFCPQAFKDAQYAAAVELEDVEATDPSVELMSSVSQSRRKSRR
jgi:hypothetical protein